MICEQEGKWLTAEEEGASCEVSAGEGTLHQAGAEGPQGVVGEVEGVEGRQVLQSLVVHRLQEVLRQVDRPQLGKVLECPRCQSVQAKFS